MKILYLIDSLGGGGAQRQLVELVKNINHNKYIPTVCTYYPDAFFKPELESRNVNFKFIGKKSRFDPGIIFKLTNFIKRGKFDIIHSFLHTPNFYAEVAGTLAGTNKIIISERDLDIFNRKTTILRKKLFHRLSDVIIVNSYAAKKSLVEVVGIDSTKISIIYNGIDTNKFKLYPEESIRDLRRELMLDEEAFVIIHVGTISGVKNHFCLLRALVIVNQMTDRRIQILLVGGLEDKELVTKLTRFIEENNLSKQVRFLGRRSDVPLLLNIADVAVLPSLWEGCPNAMLEAMACGRPVIVSDVSDNSKIIEEGKSGFLFENDNHQQFADKILKAINLNKEQRVAMGRYGRNIIERDFTIEKLVEKTCALYV